jgi:rabenosyn-5
VGASKVRSVMTGLRERGTWCRVCETCYKTREGYSDTEGCPLATCLILGAGRDHSQSFIQTRQKVVDRTYLEVNRLEKRLTKVIPELDSH